MCKIFAKSNLRLAYATFSLVFLILFLIFQFILANPNYGSHQHSMFQYFFQEVSGAFVKAKPISGGPRINDPNLKVEIVFKNAGKLGTPTTSMALLGPNDILVLEKNEGMVQRIMNGHLQPKPREVPVGNEVEWGMLGIATTKSTGKTYVFLFYTEAQANSKGVLGNRLYRYELVNDKLVNPLLLLDLP